MKTKTKLIAVTFLLISVFLNSTIGISQCISPVLLGTPARYELQPPSGDFFTVTTGTANCVTPATGSATMPGMGINVTSPAYMLDILCGGTSTKSDINISTTASAQNVGYRIGGSMVLWTGGNIQNILVGINAGNPAITGLYNSYLGYQAGVNTGSGDFNTYIGSYAGFTTTTAAANTLIGFNAGYNTNGSNPVGCYNTMTGFDCGYYNTTGLGNAYYGKRVAYMNNGTDNSMMGAHSGYYGIVSDSNSYLGTFTGFNEANGGENVMIGYDAGGYGGTASNNPFTNYWSVFVGSGSAPTCTGSYDITLGGKSDALNGTNNSVAIGYKAVVSANNSIILGNDDQWTGIGLSYTGSQGYPNNSLEICSRTQTGTIISNSSGLRFTNLTDANTPGVNPGPGVLSLDGSGNVIYVSASGTGTGIGYCSSLNSMTGSGGYNLNAKNFYFAGNGSGSAANNVIIGNTCGYTPLAKLDIAQSSGSTNTKGIFVTNTDLSSGVAGNPVPVIGIESYMPLPTSNSYYRVAGWFEADDPTVVMTHTVPSLGYAIFVPQKYNGPLTLPTSGGTVDIGYRYTLDVPTFLLKVNGRINTPSWTSPSDTILKKDVAPFNYGIKAVRKLNPISYKYNGIGGFDSSTTYIGLIAEDLKRNVPDGVVPSLIIKDTITHDTQTVENICQEAVLYTSINAIKQVDSTVTSNHKNDSIALAKQLLTNDSLRYSLDSLRSAFKSYIICLNSLCDGHSPHHSGGNENIGDTNIQNVTLSSADAPLLYQNIPNPFTSGTKINYYLPQGTAGATIVFYDNYGNQIKQVQLSQTGNGTLNITPDNLTNGIYSYSLIVNGNVIDTKRMVLQK